MKKFYMMFAAIITLAAISFVSCGSDDEDGGSTSAIRGTWYCDSPGLAVTNPDPCTCTITSNTISFLSEIPGSKEVSYKYSLRSDISTDKKFFLTTEDCTFIITVESATQIYISGNGTSSMLYQGTYTKKQ